MLRTYYVQNRVTIFLKKTKPHLHIHVQHRKIYNLNIRTRILQIWIGIHIFIYVKNSKNKCKSSSLLWRILSDKFQKGLLHLFSEYFMPPFPLLANSFQDKKGKFSPTFTLSWKHISLSRSLYRHILTLSKSDFLIRKAYNVAKQPLN